MKVSGFNTEREDWSNFSLYFEVIIVWHYDWLLECLA